MSTVEKQPQNDAFVRVHKDVAGKTDSRVVYTELTSSHFGIVSSL